MAISRLKRQTWCCYVDSQKVLRTNSCSSSAKYTKKCSEQQLHFVFADPTAEMLKKSHPGSLKPRTNLATFPTSSSVCSATSAAAGFSLFASVSATASGVSRALAWHFRDDPICLGRKILCTKDVCRIDLNPNLQNLWMDEYYMPPPLNIPNKFYIWSNPRVGLKEFYKILPCPSVPHSRSLAVTRIHWAQPRKFIIVYIQRFTASTDVTLISVYTHDNPRLECDTAIHILNVV